MIILPALVLIDADVKGLSVQSFKTIGWDKHVGN
jgi:hypothetical protein